MLKELTPLRYLSGGLYPQYTTICPFRTNNLAAFGRVLAIGIESGVLNLMQACVDGTKVRANFSRANRKSTKCSRDWWLHRRTR